MPAVMTTRAEARQRDDIRDGRAHRDTGDHRQEPQTGLQRAETFDHLQVVGQERGCAIHSRLCITGQ